MRIIRPLINFFTRDVKWKLLSLTVSVLLWFIGMNMDNPTEMRSFTRNLTPQNQYILDSNEFILKNHAELQKTDIYIGVRAKRSEFPELEARPDILRAYIDFNVIDVPRVKEADGPVVFTAPVYIESAINYDIVNKLPRFVTLEVERRFTRTVPVDIGVVGGDDTADGYEFQDAYCALATVDVTAAKSLVDSIDAVIAEIDVRGLSRTANLLVDLKVFSRGKDISDSVTLNKPKVTVSAVIYPYRTVRVEAIPMGRTASGYELIGITVSPDTVELVGTEAALNAFTVVELSYIHLNSASETFTIKMDVRDSLVGGIDLRKNTPHEVEVTVAIERMQPVEVIIPIDQILAYGLSQSMTYKLLGDTSITVTLRGPESQMGSITAPGLSPRLILTGLGVGVHTVPLTLTLKEKVTQTGNPATVDVEISTPDPSPQDSEPEDETPTP